MKPVSERRYPHERRHNLPAGREALLEQAQRDARQTVMAFDNDLSEIRFDAASGMMLVTLYVKD